MKATAILLACMCFIPSIAAAQFCGTITDDAFMDRFDRLIASESAQLRAATDTGIVDVPVTFHVEREGGNPVVSSARIAAAMQATNRWFADAGVRFVTCGEIRYFSEDAQSDVNRRTVNVSIHASPDGCGFATGSFVSINIRCNRTLENILSHELGHVMGLPHTHGYTNSGTTNELVDGSNCATAGDRFCDTPADPNLLGKVNRSCTYTGSARDANGMQYRPLTHDIMSYTISRCADTLTPMQLERVRAVALAADYVCCGILEPVVHDTAVCVGATVTLHASTPVGTLTWYDSPEGGNPVGFGPSFTTPPLEAPRAWYVEAEDSCRSPRARVLVRVLPSTGVLTDQARVVRDIDTAASSNPSRLLVTDTLLFFTVSRGQLWCTDGTEKGTRLRMDMSGGDGEAGVTGMIAWNDMLLFGINDRSRGPSLWRMPVADGAAEKVVQFPAREEFSNFFLTDAGAWVLFMLNDGDDRTELWRTDGTAAGTTRIRHLPHTNAFEDFGFAALDGIVYFQASDSLHGGELWRSDGTAGGTSMLADIAAGAGGSDPQVLTPAEGLLYFTAADSVHGRELWVSDGTREGTMLIADINAGEDDSRPYGITMLDGSLYFSADDGAAGPEPFISDGTPGGTRRLADLRPENGSFPSEFFMLNGAVFCAANDGGGTELWRLDPAGLQPPQLLRDINPFSGSYPRDVVPHAGKVYFQANDGLHGRELWRSDGTRQGTWLVADIDTGAASGAPSNMTVFRGRLYFAATDARVGRELRVLSPLDIEICNGEGALLRAENVEGVVSWYDAEDAATPLGSGRVFTTAPLHRSRRFWADVSVGGCRSARVPVAVRVRAPDPVVRDTVVPPNTMVLLRAIASEGQIHWYRNPADALPLAVGGELAVRIADADTLLYVVTVDGDCRSAAFPLRVRVDAASGLVALPSDGALQAWPHPVRGVMRLRLPAPADAADIVICDMLGRVQRRWTRARSRDGVLELNCAGLRSGTYMMQVRQAGAYRQRVIVVR